MSLNTLTLSGYLGNDAELRYSKSNTPFVSFSLAVNERVPDGNGSYSDYTNWVDCVMFGKRAESLHRYLSKGAKVSIIGHLHTRMVDNNGKRYKRWDVRVDNVELMMQAMNQTNQNNATNEPAVSGGYDEMVQSDIPF